MRVSFQEFLHGDIMKQVTYALVFIFSIFVVFAVVLHFLKLISQVFLHPEVKLFAQANRDVFVEWVDGLGYAIANLRCYWSNLFVSEELVNIDDYF